MVLFITLYKEVLLTFKSECRHFLKKEVLYWCQSFCWWFSSKDESNYQSRNLERSATIQSQDSLRKFFPFKLSIIDRRLLQRNSKILPHCERKRQNT